MSRYTLIIPVKDVATKSVTRVFAKELNRFNNKLTTTMTYGNGTEMDDHKWLTNHNGIKGYFANPYTSWERATNENTNGLIRHFSPKKIPLKS